MLTESAMDSTADSGLMDLARGIGALYDGFAEKVQALGSRANGSRKSSKMGESFARWIGGSHVTTVRDQLCDSFLADVQGQLELLTAALEMASPEEAARAAYEAAEVILAPQPAKSNGTATLMRRAMAGQAEPLLPYLTKEQLTVLRDGLAGAYGKRQALPVENAMVHKMNALLET